jgi:hypothetical protein
MEPLKSSRQALGSMAIPAGIFIFLGIASSAGFAQTPGPCTRYAPGSIVQDPPNLFSSNGVLRLNLSYNREVDADGRILFCFTTPSGKESPTLHVRRGDLLVVKVKNNVPASPPIAAHADASREYGDGVSAMAKSDRCGSVAQTPVSGDHHHAGLSGRLHQIHFLLMAINGVPVPAAQQQLLLDMVQVPILDGLGSLSERNGAAGFSRAGCGGFCLSLSDPGPRGRRHDGHHQSSSPQDQCGWSLWKVAKPPGLDVWGAPNWSGAFRLPIAIRSLADETVCGVGGAEAVCVLCSCGRLVSSI